MLSARTENIRRKADSATTDHHNEPTASWRPRRTALRLSDCAELHSVGLRRRALKSGFVNLWVGASRQLGEKGDLHGQCVFRHQLANVMTGMIAAGHRNSFAPDCVRHLASSKAASLKPVMTDQFGDYRQGVRGDTNR